MPKTTLDYLEEILVEIHDQHNQHPEGTKIRYEVYLGEDDVEDSDDEGVSYHLRLDALNQLSDEGVITDYVIDERYEDFPLGEFGGTRLTYKVANCLVDKEKLALHPRMVTDEEMEKAFDYNPDTIEITLKDGNLKINRLTGIVHFNEIPTQFNPTSKQFEVILKLASSKDYQATYEDLIGSNTGKEAIRQLTFVIRNIKITLGILPANKAKQKDFIQNIKNHGYKLVT